MRFLQGSMLHINKELIQASSVGARHGLFFDSLRYIRAKLTGRATIRTTFCRWT